MATEKIVIYHNPKCTKSRQTLQLLDEQAHDAEVEVIEYLNTPPDKEELKRIIKLLGMNNPRELMRKKEKIYESEHLDDSKLTLDTLINAMVNHPILIERPIVIANGKAAIGRPPENVLAIL